MIKQILIMAILTLSITTIKASRIGEIDEGQISCKKYDYSDFIYCTNGNYYKKQQKNYNDISFSQKMTHEFSRERSPLGKFKEYDTSSPNNKNSSTIRQ